ncbi:MAG: glucosaminidase domain-containing protein, partial [Thermaerobacterales bacterium]
TEGLPAGAAEVRYLLLDPDTGRGPVVARGADLFGGHQWLPDPVHEGRRLLAAVLYDHNGRFLTGEAVSVRVSPQTSVSLEGVAAGQRITASVSLRPRFNFIATHVRYELVDPATGVVTGIAEADPEATFSWTPGFTHNGTRSLRVTAYDRLGRAHSSAAVSVNVAMARQVSLGGVTTGRTLQRPVTLRTGANFPVQSVRYMLRRAGGDHELARRNGSGTLRWVPEPGQSGAAELFVVVTDGSGAQHASAPVPVTVSAAPGIFVETVGPNQVLAGTVDLRAVTNVSVNRVDYQLIHPGSGAVKTIAGGSDASAVYKWTPASNDAGSWRLRAVAHTAGGQVLTSEELPVRVHTGALFAARPVIAKNQFQDFAANLAVTSQAETGMSAALQVAQAILESGWGQFSPVDKYSGQLSHNLFGIKGSGPAGSVISNTWEEYNGVAYRVDDNFRAYQSVKQSWDDHKRLVLTVSRYAPFRAVMHDGTRGAWALRRAGYATDSQYPLKLINLMKQYDLYRLDDVSP